MFIGKNPWILANNAKLSIEEIRYFMNKGTYFELPKGISQEFLQFLQSIFTQEPSSRASASQLLASEFLKSVQGYNYKNTPLDSKSGSSLKSIVTPKSTQNQLNTQISQISSNTDKTSGSSTLQQIDLDSSFKRLFNEKQLCGNKKLGFNTIVDPGSGQPDKMENVLHHGKDKSISLNMDQFGANNSNDFFSIEYQNQPPQGVLQKFDISSQYSVKSENCLTQQSLLSFLNLKQSLNSIDAQSSNVGNQENDDNGCIENYFDELSLRTK